MVKMQCKKPGFDPWIRKVPGGSHGNPFLYSCLENSTDRGAWWALVLGVAKTRTCLKRLSTHMHDQVGASPMAHGEKSTCSAGDRGDVCSIPRWGRSPGEGNDNPLQRILTQRILLTEEPGGL